mgnify:CR=1 FL=1|tara:strand:- start:483 stop:1049 length:567 start_codon:yes stop_codon:yes gene_type:complete
MIDFAKVPTSFETERFLVRKYALNDDQILYSAARESINDVYKFLPWCHPNYEIIETRQWLTHVNPDWKQNRANAFAITNKADGKFLGGIGLSRIDEHPVANLGYWVRSSAVGDGVATESVMGLARFGFTHLHLIRIEIIMSTENAASKKVAEKSGAKYEGILRNRLLLHGRCHDAHCYSLLRSDVGLI